MVFCSDRGPGSKIFSPIIRSIEDATIDCLIDENERHWNAKIVDGIFIPKKLS